MEAETEGACSEIPKETVDFKIVFNKQKHDVTFPLDDKVQDLKQHIEKITGNWGIFDVLDCIIVPGITIKFNIYII